MHGHRETYDSKCSQYANVPDIMYAFHSLLVFCQYFSDPPSSFNGLQVKGGLVPRVYEKFNISRFCWCLKKSFYICASFPITHIIIKIIFRKSACMTWNRGSTPPPLIERLSGPYKFRFPPTSSTYQKHLKLGQCLEIDDSRPLSKFGEFTWSSSHFTGRSVFCRPTF